MCITNSGGICATVEGQKKLAGSRHEPCLRKINLSLAKGFGSPRRMHRDTHNTTTSGCCTHWNQSPAHCCHLECHHARNYHAADAPNRLYRSGSASLTPLSRRTMCSSTQRPAKCRTVVFPVIPLPCLSPNRSFCASISSEDCEYSLISM